MKVADYENVQRALMSVTTEEIDAGAFERGYNAGIGVAMEMLGFAKAAISNEPEEAEEPAEFGVWHKPARMRPKYGEIVLVEPESGHTCTGYVHRYDNCDRWYDHVGNGINPKRWCYLPIQIQEGA